MFSVIFYSLSLILQPGEGLSILQLEKELRTQVDILAKKKHDRMKQLKKLKDTDQHLCDLLCTTPYYIPTGSIPSMEQLKELEQHIQTLSDEKVFIHFTRDIEFAPKVITGNLVSYFCGQ